MKTVILKLSSLLTFFASIPSLAQSFEVSPVVMASPAAMPHHVSSVVYKNASENQLAGVVTVSQVAAFGGGADTSVRLTIFRANDLGVQSFRSNMLVQDDGASFKLSAPTPTVNGVLTLAGTVAQMPMNGSAAKWVQALSVAATRKVNAELAYSAKLGASSRFDSAITYRLHPNSDAGASDVVASVKYSLRF